ncbi:TPA: AAA family ATPase [Stenotrophomonas maltophilia]|uniref:AAA family ATPase n=2 Tax=Gammaproteobacteria TaxID=1236 RepID=UPI001312A86C|nr:AAA family ATPase [Stenotrophomonas maltophilia]MBH1464647.1 AAA family ATPase [Stenotrophomonas maltophilia]MBH1612142.1 AAA family ATPase [Stenotrophomonas maltophilia]MBH1715874.1 AAA family ATPase [Stenotrophomonas maltophilia]MBN5167012.1 AAA family ATPase [Stenotrophomonas maltophilia]HEL3236741.1 AAA family ATPase [Stenotrophomonas maltophilia]
MNHDSKNKPALRIDSLRLRNFRCFDEVTVKFHEQLTVIVANNGQGKTAVMDAVAIALGPFVSAFDDGKDRPFERDDIRLIRVGQGNRMELADGGVRLEATGVVGHKSESWKRELAGAKSRTTRKDARVLTQEAKKLQSQVRQETEILTTATCLPLVAYYPTDRLWNIRRLPYKKLPRTSRMVGYTHCLESGSDFHLMADWFRYWSINSLKRRLHAQQAGEIVVPNEFDYALEAVRNAINLCLKPSGWGGMDYSLEREEIVASHPLYGELPVGMLSDGIRSMLTLVADIAFRMVKLNPNLGPHAATNADGVVLIDEVDMHLHPTWQQTVLTSLREAFPCVQFIVTTHSPQVLSTVSKEHIRVLQHVDDLHSAEQPSFSPLAHESGDALAKVMGTQREPELAIQDAIRRYEQLVRQGREESEDAGVLLNELEQEGYQFHESDLATWRFLAKRAKKAV